MITNFNSLQAKQWFKTLATCPLSSSTVQSAWTQYRSQRANMQAQCPITQNDSTGGPRKDEANERLSIWFLREGLPSVLWCCWLRGKKSIQLVKNWVVGRWRGYLSGARCRLAYGPADAITTHCLLLQYNPDWFYLSGTALVVSEKGPLNGCIRVRVHEGRGNAVPQYLIPRASTQKHLEH